MRLPGQPPFKAEFTRIGVSVAHDCQNLPTRRPRSKLQSFTAAPRGSNETLRLVCSCIIHRKAELRSTAFLLKLSDEALRCFSHGFCYGFSHSMFRWIKHSNGLGQVHLKSSGLEHLICQPQAGLGNSHTRPHAAARQTGTSLLLAV